MTDVVKSDEVSPSEFLTQVNKFFVSKLGEQVNTIQEMMHSHMEEFVLENCLTTSDAKHIDFHIELKDFEFKFRPHNLFTYLLSEGIFVSIADLGEHFMYRTDSGVYKFDKEEMAGCFIPRWALSEPAR